ncbi:MAG: HEAT repeat domain-containing protein [Promethearchaeota archaeon]
MVVISVAFIFAVKTPSLWTSTPPEVNPVVLLIPFVICLIYISVYPLIDFLFIALSKESDEGLTPFHKIIGNRIINISQKKLINVIIAISFYVCVFLVPPLLLTLIGLPFIMIWITWMIAYPLMILTFYGTKGYIAGISNSYYHIPNISRSIFLNFEDKKRGMKQFASEPGPYIILGLMIFVFFWAWISLFQTIAFFFTKTLVISTMSSVFVFVTLFFGIIGYFTRFWGRKIKYRGIDIYFAAYLMAAIGINVLVNFLIVNFELLSTTFSSFNLTAQINVNNYIMFAWAAVIEEIVLIIFTSFYFLARNNEFIKNIRYSKITECGQAFDPIPLFNFIKHHDPEIRKHAEDTLLLMFERIPLKKEIDLNEWKFKNLILDGISDNNTNSRSVCLKIFENLFEAVPNIILSWIIESLDSPNYDKNVPILRLLINTDNKFIEKIPKETISNLLNEREWRLKLLGLKLASRLIKNDRELINELKLKRLIYDPNSKIQIEVLKIFADSTFKIPDNIIIDKISHSNNEIRAVAIRNLKNLSQEGFNDKFLSKIIPLMKDPSSSVRASIFNILASIGKFKKNKIPLLPLLDGLNDLNENIRNSATMALLKFFNERPNLLDLDAIINRIDPKKINTLNSILSLLGRLWKHDPKKILTTLLIFIKFEGEQLKTNISNIIAENYPNDSDLIIQDVIKIPDDSGYIIKGIIAKTLIKIGKKDPVNLVKNLILFLDNENDDIKLNAIASLDGLVDELPSSTNIKPIINLLQKDKNKQTKKEASKLLSQIAQKDPNFIKPLISDFIQSIDEQEPSVRVVLFKSLLEIANVSPQVIPLEKIVKYLSDEDSFIRESSTKILGIIGYKNPMVVTDNLINIALIDEDWIVREAAVSSLGAIVDHQEDKKRIIEKLTTLLDGEQGWVRRSALIILSNIEEVDETYVPFKKLLNCLNNEDTKVREAAAGLLKIYSSNIEEIFDSIVELLGDREKEVRTSMINSIVALVQKVGLSHILSKLLKNLSDTGSIEIQRSISLILGRTAKYENEKIKKRIISVLKIRCEMSQDPIICGTLQQLKESSIN